MGTFQIKLKIVRRKKAHLKYLKRRIWDLKYEILNEAIKYKSVNNNKIDLFHKYQKRLKLITFFK